MQLVVVDFRPPRRGSRFSGRGWWPIFRERLVNEEESTKAWQIFRERLVNEEESGSELDWRGLEGRRIGDPNGADQAIAVLRVFFVICQARRDERPHLASM